MAIGNIPKTKREYREFFAGGPGAQGGSKNGAGVTIEASQAGYTKTVLRFEDTPIPLVDEAGVVAYGSLKVFDMPAGLILIAGAVADLAVTTEAVDPEADSGVIATFDGDFGVGTTAAGNNNALATTEQNIIPTTPTPQAVGGATTAKGVSTAGVVLDGTGTAADVFLNFLVDDADQDVTTEPSRLVVNGTLTLIWALAGDK